MATSCSSKRIQSDEALSGKVPGGGWRTPASASIGEVGCELGSNIDEHFERIGKDNGTGDGQGDEGCVDSLCLRNEGEQQSGLDEERGAEVEMINEPAAGGLLSEQSTRISVD